VPVLYDMVCFIQDEFAEFISDMIGDIGDDGSLMLEYNTSGEFQKVFD